MSFARRIITLSKAVTEAIPLQNLPYKKFKAPLFGVMMIIDITSIPLIGMAF